MVRVPVLSEQMTEVQPRVSTEGRLLTMAFFLAMRRVPRARQVVMTAGRPAIWGRGLDREPPDEKYSHYKDDIWNRDKYQTFDHRCG